MKSERSLVVCPQKPEGGKGGDLQTSTGFGFSIIKSNRSHRAMTVGTETENREQQREERTEKQNTTAIRT